MQSSMDWLSAFSGGRPRVMGAARVGQVSPYTSSRPRSFLAILSSCGRLVPILTCAEQWKVLPIRHGRKT